MNSKERVALTISHQEPDRVPVGEFGIDHDHVSKVIGHHTYWRNRKDTTLALWEGRRDEVVDSLKKDCEELTKKLDYDIITVELVPPKNYYPEDPPRKTGDGIWEDSRGNKYKYAASNDSISCVSQASEGRTELTEQDLDNAMQKAGKFDESIFELVDYMGDRYGEDHAVIFRSIDANGYLNAPFGGDFSHQLILSLLYPEELKKMYDACFMHNKKLLEHCAQHHVMIAMQGHDYGMNTGCMISPESIRDIYMPMMSRINIETVRQGMIPFFHCCGNIWDIMADFVQAGYKGYQSIQESAGMDSKRVKDLYGDSITLWTGVQCETLVSGSLADTEEEVRKNLRNLMPGGGFIFGSTNSVQYGAKTDNYLKALEIVRNQGIYK